MAPAFTTLSATLTLLNMKVLVAVCILQLLLIVYLAMDSAGSNGSNQEDPLRRVVSQQLPISLPPVEYSNETVLRRIIREELAAYLSEQEPTRKQHLSSRLEPISQYSKQDVEYSIEQLKGIGVVSDHEMMALESKIVTLEEKDRLQMMAKLVAAMKSGEIDAQFQ